MEQSAFIIISTESVNAKESAHVEKIGKQNANKDYGNDCLTNHIVDCDFKQTKTTKQKKTIMNKFWFLVFFHCASLYLSIMYFFC